MPGAPCARGAPARRPAVGRLPDGAHVVERLAVASSGPARCTRGRPGSAGASGPDVVGGDGADVAQRLRDDQVGLELADELRVERVDRRAVLRALAHGAVDLASGQALGEDVARDIRELGASGG